MAEITVPAAEAWDITPSEFNTLQHRSFKAVPKEKLVVDYHTFERYHDQVIDAVVPVEVLQAEIRHYWVERDQEWESQISLQMFQLNPKTMERYSHRNPKSNRLYTRDEGVPMEAVIKAVLMEATQPRTRIVVTEVAA